MPRSCHARAMLVPCSCGERVGRPELAEGGGGGRARARGGGWHASELTRWADLGGAVMATRANVRWGVSRRRGRVRVAAERAEVYHLTYSCGARCVSLFGVGPCDEELL